MPARKTAPRKPGKARKPANARNPAPTAAPPSADVLSHPDLASTLTKAGIDAKYLKRVLEVDGKPIYELRADGSMLNKAEYLKNGVVTGSREVLYKEAPDARVVFK